MKRQKISNNHTFFYIKSSPARARAHVFKIVLKGIAISSL